MFHDWNNNGKTDDMFDNFMDYMVMNEIFNNDDDDDDEDDDDE